MFAVRPTPHVHSTEKLPIRREKQIIVGRSGSADYQMGKSEYPAIPFGDNAKFGNDECEYQFRRLVVAG